MKYSDQQRVEKMRETTEKLLRQQGYGRTHGDARALNIADNHFLSFLSEIYY